nr:uncharacterized protein LOC123772699 [Procambarus clarkii]
MSMQRWCCMKVVMCACIWVLTAGDDQSTPGIDLLQEYMQTDPTKVCHYIQCQEPLRAVDCPVGTLYQHGVTQLGCCGACVRYKQAGEGICTGNLDPKFNSGYGTSTSQREHLSLFSESYDNIVTSSWCDYALNCSQDGVCRVDDQARGCKYVQRRYDEDRESGSIMPYRDDYRWRPTCTLDGQYAEKQCKGPYSERRCVCVDPEGLTIYGKAFTWQRDLYQDMNCKCSRRLWELQQAGKTTMTLHCLENGNYEPLQCEDGWCYCIDPATAIPYGPALPEDVMNILPCYNATTTGQQYLRRCDSVYHAHYLLLDYMKAKNMQGPSITLNCDPDGSYGGLQYSFDGTYRCYDKYDNKYDSLIAQPAGGGCNCARDRLLYQENHMIVTLTCTTSDYAAAGVYNQFQVAGEVIYCVDQDGIRASSIILEKFKDKLNCAKAVECQNGNLKSCDEVCDGCPNDAYPAYNAQSSYNNSTFERR